MKHAKTKDKYAELRKRKSCKYTADNRPIEIYSRGKERIYIAYDENNNMEIVGHNPIPLVTSLLASKTVRNVGASVVSSVLGKSDKAETKREIVNKPKSLRDNIIEREVYGDKDFSIYH